MAIVNWNAPEIQARLRVGAMRGVVEGLGIVEGRAVQLIMQGPKSGRVYRRRGVVHQASAPGEAPASDTGGLVNARRTDLNEQDVSGILAFTSRHASPLEHGTRNMAPRSFARRALMETREQIVAAISRNAAAQLR
jgi:hypothetical protein